MIDLRAGTWRLERADGRVENSPGRTGFDVMYEQQLQAVLGLVKGELDPIPLPGYREARDVMALIDAARRSSALGGSLEQMENA